MLDLLRQDARMALRGLRRAPAFTLSAILILAIAIGMAAAMATIFDAVLRRRLPVQQQDRIAVLWAERGRWRRVATRLRRPRAGAEREPHDA